MTLRISDLNRHYLLSSLLIVFTVVGAGLVSSSEALRLSLRPCGEPLPNSGSSQTHTTNPGTREWTLLFVGDVMLARGVGQMMKAKMDWAYPFRKVGETLAVANLTVGNLECPVSEVGRERGHRYSLRADPKAIEGLKYAGFDVMSLANNHVYDWGPTALLDTLERLREARIRAVGAGANAREASYPAIIDLGGLRVGLLAYVSIEPREAAADAHRAGVAWLESERVLADIRFARQLVDLLVVCPHWGVEYARRPQASQVDLAHRMIEAGADLIVGSHPHVVQPCERYRHGWIAYSLGNFVFDQREPATRRGLMLKVKVCDKEIAEVTPLPTIIGPTFQAAPLTGGPSPPAFTPVRSAAESPSQTIH